LSGASSAAGSGAFPSTHTPDVKMMKRLAGAVDPAVRGRLAAAMIVSSAIFSIAGPRPDTLSSAACT
jgi:hypothetical protein